MRLMYMTDGDLFPTVMAVATAYISDAGDGSTDKVTVCFEDVYSNGGRVKFMNISVPNALDWLRVIFTNGYLDLTSFDAVEVFD